MKLTLTGLTILVAVSIQLPQLSATLDGQLEVEGKLENNVLIFEWDTPAPTVVQTNPNRWEITFPGYTLEVE